MRTPEQLRQALGAERDQILAIVRDHEQAKHSGFPCWKERIGIVAFLFHCLGIPDCRPSWEFIAELVRDYAEECQKNGGCGAHGEEVPDGR